VAVGSPGGPSGTVTAGGGGSGVGVGAGVASATIGVGVGAGVATGASPPQAVIVNDAMAVIPTKHVKNLDFLSIKNILLG